MDEKSKCEVKRMVKCGDRHRESHPPQAFLHKTERNEPIGVLIVDNPHTGFRHLKTCYVNYANVPRRTRPVESAVYFRKREGTQKEYAVSATPSRMLGPFSQTSLGKEEIEVATSNIGDKLSAYL